MILDAKTATYFYLPTKKNADGKRPKVRLGKEKQKALKAYHKVGLDRTESAPNTVGAIINDYLQDETPTKAELTQEDHRRQAKNLKAVFGKMPISAVKPLHISQYLKNCRQNSRPIQGNREVSFLSSVFTMAVEQGYIDDNPCKKVRRNKETPKDRYVTDEEFWAVKALAGERMAAIMDLAYLTAMREGDLLRLRLDALTPHGIQYQPRKTSRRSPQTLSIGWSPALRATVKRLKKLRPPIAAMTLITTRRGKTYTTSGLQSNFYKVVTKAMNQGLLTERFSFYDIRAKALSDADDAGKDAQRLAGHATPQMTEVYLRSRRVRKVEAVK